MALIDYAAEPRTPLVSLIKATSVIARARSIDEVIATIRASARSRIGCEGVTPMPAGRGHPPHQFNPSLLADGE